MHLPAECRPRHRRRGTPEAPAAGRLRRSATPEAGYGLRGRTPAANAAKWSCSRGRSRASGPGSRPATASDWSAATTARSQPRGRCSAASPCRSTRRPGPSLGAEARKHLGIILTLMRGKTHPAARRTLPRAGARAALRHAAAPPPPRHRGAHRAPRLRDAHTVPRGGLRRPLPAGRRPVSSPATNTTILGRLGRDSRSPARESRKIDYLRSRIRERKHAP